tara:strand:+ start:14515 stop:15027 length:513 start_codon:yes stop_codon:yes gene_type:complete
MFLIFKQESLADHGRHGCITETKRLFMAIRSGLERSLVDDKRCSMQAVPHSALRWLRWQMRVRGGSLESGRTEGRLRRVRSPTSAAPHTSLPTASSREFRNEQDNLSKHQVQLHRCNALMHEHLAAFFLVEAAGAVSGSLVLFRDMPSGESQLSGSQAVAMVTARSMPLL